MKFNWGYKILFMYLAFVAGILFLVFKASGERYDLVTDNYYEQELKYQDIIDQKARVDRLSAPPQVHHDAKQLRISFPEELSARTINGECYLYRPSDEKQDIRKAFTISNGEFVMDYPRVLDGMYDLKLSWTSGGQQYFFEKKIFF